MSNATANMVADMSATATTVRARAVRRRFLWKELRLLWGLWLAVLAAAVILQLAIRVLNVPSTNLPALLQFTGWAAAVLYTVGAAATMFAVEHEEGTYDFLVCLPTTAWPVYFGKVVIVAATSVALAVGVSVSGWMLSGFSTPVDRDMMLVVGVFGVAIFEALAWGTLFSLLVKRPLVAAVLALVVGTMAVNLAVYLSWPSAGANLRFNAYVEATPLRLAIVAIVLAWGAIVARNWLSGSGASDSETNNRPQFGWTSLRRTIARPFRRRRARSAAQASRMRTTMPRLLWQTWRDAKSLLALPLLIATALVIGTWAAVILTRPGDTVSTAAFTATCFFVPALYGAMAFAGDQRRRHYRFLAEHAGVPRHVWLARQAIWLGTVVAIAATIWLAISVLVALGIKWFSDYYIANYVHWWTAPQFSFDTPHEAGYVVAVLSLAWQGIFTAYAVGQFCSMFVRSEILATVLAIVVSIFLSGWVAVLFAWGLSGLLFLLPLAAALMLATWLRAPDWIADRNTWRSWSKSLLPLAAALVVIAVALPRVRLAQIDDQPTSASIAYRRPAGPLDIESYVAGHQAGATPKARETAAMYLRAVELFEQEESPAAAVELALEASSRPTCRFEFELDLISPGWMEPEYNLRVYELLNRLLGSLSAGPDDVSFERLLAALRMSVHIRAGQPTVVVLDQFEREQAILEQIDAWAGGEARTSAELKDARDRLIRHFRSLPWFPETLIADHVLVSKVLKDEMPSVAVAKDPESWLVQLAHLAHQFPWERERGRLALERITQQNFLDAKDLYQYLPTGDVREIGNSFVRQWLRPTWSPWTETWIVANPAAATSYLARLEYQARVPVHKLFRGYCDIETFRRATLLQLALAMYRSDTGDYPVSLSQLVPDYLEHIPIDPYSGQPFEYRAVGLELPLRGRRASNFQQIEAQTPLFWSVGAGDARLKRWTYIDSVPVENDPLADPIETSETVYALDSDELPWGSEPAFAFPLPK